MRRAARLTGIAVTLGAVLCVGYWLGMAGSGSTPSVTRVAVAGATVPSTSGDGPDVAVRAASSSRPERAEGSRPLGSRVAAPGATAHREASPRVAAPGPARVLRTIPGLGPATSRRIPAASRQVVVVRGTAGSSAVAVLWVRGPAGWTLSGRWPATVGKNGWAEPARRVEGGLRTPAGVFTLSDAGGPGPRPAGTRLSWTRSTSFVARGHGVDGEPLTGAFDAVVAIDFNRVPGRSPLDAARPDGAGRGGGIWFHVDHGGPTRGCVALPRAAMSVLLHSLDPAARPVVVMGPAAALAR